MKRHLLLLSAALIIFSTAWADVEINENTFPDEYFRNWVLSKEYGKDGILTNEEIAGITKIIFNTNKIHSLKGIEYFTELTTLYCTANPLTELDVTKCTKLTYLECIGNQLTTLDVSKNTALTELNCSENPLKTLDISNNTQLVSLHCQRNELTALDVSNNTALETLSCNGNQLTELDVSKNKNLKRLVCSNNQLTGLELKSLPKLENLKCLQNRLERIIVSECPKLEEIDCFNNQISGEAMDEFIEGLPVVPNGWGHLCIVDPENEQNVMTKAQVAAVKAKGWHPRYKYGSFGTPGYTDYEGIDEPTSVVADGQLFKPLGLGMETSRNMVGDWYQPQMHVEGDILYVCTNQGLYSKDLSSEGSEWQLVGFEGIPLQDYARRGDDILALRHCYYEHSEFLLFSHDSGRTYEDITPAFFKGRGYAFLSLEQHPTDPNTLLTSTSSGCGMFMTADFGQTWEKLADYTPDYMGFHPLNPEIIYECSGGGFTDEKTDVRISYDRGQTWQEKAQCFSNYNTVFRMAFHPTQPNKWIAGGYQCVYTTNDNGQTWDTQHLHDYDNPLNPLNEDYNAPWRYAAYDNENTDIVYMAGGYHNEYMKLMCSTDGGKTWNRPYLEPIKTSPTEYVFDMKQYGDKLLIYSQSDVYMISKADLIAQTTPVTFTEGQMATIILPTNPDASKGKYYRLDRYEDGQIIFEQELQPQAHIPYIIVPNEDFSIDLSALDLAGCYRDTVSVDGISFIGSYVSETFDYPDGFYIDFIDITPDCRFDESCVIGALRAYLLVRWDDPYNQGGTRVPPLNKRGIVLRDYETGITSSLRETGEATLYDLQGRMLPSKPAQGIYIENGNKILIK